MKPTPHIFISSTYKDLKKERQKVIEAIYEMEYVPRCMEIFPSSRRKQMDYIKGVIDECDCFILIIAGRYGTIDNNSGDGYVEEEYDYAVQTNKPILVFLYHNINNLKREKIDIDPTLIERLKNFKDKVSGSNRLVSFWRNSSDLKSKVLKSLQEEFRTRGKETKEKTKNDTNTEIMHNKETASNNKTQGGQDRIIDLQTLESKRRYQIIERHVDFFYNLAKENGLSLKIDGLENTVTKLLERLAIRVKIFGRVGDVENIDTIVSFTNSEWFFIIGRFLSRAHYKSLRVEEIGRELNKYFTEQLKKHFLFSQKEESSFIFINEVAISNDYVNNILYNLKSCNLLINDAEEIDVMFEEENRSIFELVHWSISSVGKEYLLYSRNIRKQLKL